MKNSHPTRKKTAPATPDEIRALREAAGLSQAQAAALVCRPQPRWAEWESGVRNIQQDAWELFLIKLWFARTQQSALLEEIVEGRA